MTNKINWFKAFYKRIGAGTPIFFKKIIYFGITLGAIGGGIIIAKDQFPTWLVELANTMVIVGLVSGIVAKAAVIDPQSIQGK